MSSRRISEGRSSGSAPSARSSATVAAAGSSNIASDSAFRGRGVTGAHYATRRPGLLALTRRAAAALAADGVTVNAVAPGTIDGETVRELAGERIDELAAEIPVGRLGRPGEIAAARRLAALRRRRLRHRSRRSWRATAAPRSSAVSRLGGERPAQEPSRLPRLTASTSASLQPRARSAASSAG